MGKTAQLKIENAIGNKDPWLELWGITDTTFSATDMSKFLTDNQDADTIEIEIRSDGGNVDVAFDCYDQLKAWVSEKAGRKIVTKGYRVNSAATIIFLSAESSDRYVSDNVQFVIHNPYVCDLWGTYTAEDLAKLEQYVRDAEDKIFNFYCERTGIDDSKKEELKSLMDQDTDLGKDKALSFNFASNTITGASAPVQDKKQKPAFAYTNEMGRLVTASIKNQTTMSNKILDSINDKLNKLLNIKNEGDGTQTEVKDETNTLKDGTKFYSNGTLAVDVEVYSDEAMTQAMADGDYTLEDDRTFTVKGGKVTALNDAPATNSTETEKQLNDKITELQNKLNASEVQNKTLKDGLKEVKNDFEKHKKEVSGAHDPNADTDPGKTGTVKNSIQQTMMKISKEKNQKK